MYEVDDELTALFIEAHRNIGFLEGLLIYASNKNTFSELMLLKECAYSLMIDYDSPAFQDILVNRGSGKETSKNLSRKYKVDQLFVEQIGKYVTGLKDSNWV